MKLKDLNLNENLQMKKSGYGKLKTRGFAKQMVIMNGIGMISSYFLKILKNKISL